MSFDVIRTALQLPSRARVHACVHRGALLGSVLMLAACAGPGPSIPSTPRTAPPLPRTAEPPAPKVNLSGFPLAYRQGYADGCASATGAQRRDGERFASDGNYSMGWQDGIALCRKR